MISSLPIRLHKLGVHKFPMIYSTWNLQKMITFGVSLENTKNLLLIQSG